MILALVACWAEPTPTPTQAQATEATVTGQAMGGTLRIVVRCTTVHADCLAQGVAARTEVERIEALATDWTETGEIARLNATGSAKVSPEVAELLAAARSMAERTGGAFDPTINALWRLWDFEAARIADPDELARKLPRVDWHGLELDGDQARIRPGQSVSLGGIAQGYAAAKALEMLPGEAMVDLSGDIAVRGAWEIGIQHPRLPRGEMIARVVVQDAVLSTSGDYEKFFEKDGVRYHHVLDPRTGLPAQGAISATVVARDGSVADALDTALMVLGPDPVPVLALGAWALVVTADGTVHEVGRSGQVSGLRLSP